jgi:F0F1-type ATP synthase assembly protein I
MNALSLFLVGLVIGFVAGVLVVLFWALGKAAKMGDG